MLKVESESEYRSFKQVPKILEKNLSKEEVKTLNNLVNNKDIAIQKADKVNNVVILNRSDYIPKLSKILEDTSELKGWMSKMEKLWIIWFIWKNKSIILLKSLEDQGEISEKERNDLYPSGSQPEVLYELAKIHKALVDGIPSFQPIFSAIVTPTYKLIKFCDQLLKPRTKNEYTIKDSFSFAKEVLEFHASLFMASFDIK